MKGLLVLGFILVATVSNASAQSRKPSTPAKPKPAPVVCPMLAGNYEKCSSGSLHTDRVLGISDKLTIQQSKNAYTMVSGNNQLTATLGQKNSNTKTLEGVTVDYIVSASCRPELLTLKYEVTKMQANDSAGIEITKEIVKDLVENENTTYELNGTTLDISGGAVPVTCQKI